MAEVIRIPGSRPIYKPRAEFSGREQRWDERFILGRIPEYDAFQDKHCLGYMVTSSVKKKKLQISPIKYHKGRSPVAALLPRPGRTFSVKRLPASTKKPAHVGSVLKQLRSNLLELWGLEKIPEEVWGPVVEAMDRMAVKERAEALAREIDDVQQKRSVLQSLIKAISSREQALSRLFVLTDSSPSAVSLPKLTIDAKSVLASLRMMTLHVVECAAAYKDYVCRLNDEDSLRIPVLFHGENYILKLTGDLSYLAQSNLASVFEFSTHGDPFLLMPAKARKKTREDVPLPVTLMTRIKAAEKVIKTELSLFKDDLRDSEQSSDQRQPISHPHTDIIAPIQSHAIASRFQPSVEQRESSPPRISVGKRSENGIGAEKKKKISEIESDGVAFSSEMPSSPAKSDIATPKHHHDISMQNSSERRDSPKAVTVTPTPRESFNTYKEAQKTAAVTSPQRDLPDPEPPNIPQIPTTKPDTSTSPSKIISGSKPNEGDAQLVSPSDSHPHDTETHPVVPIPAITTPLRSPRNLPSASVNDTPIVLSPILKEASEPPLTSERDLSEANLDPSSNQLPQPVAIEPYAPPASIADMQISEFQLTEVLLKAELDRYLATVPAAIRETFWDSTSFATIAKESYPAWIQMTRSGKRVGIMSFSVDTLNNSAKRIVINHVSAQSMVDLEAALDCGIHHIWSTIACKEIRISINYRDIDGRMEADPAIKAVIASRKFRWKNLTNKGDGRRVIIMALQRPAGIDLPSRSEDFFSENLVLKYAAAVQASADVSPSAPKPSGLHPISLVGFVACLKDTKSELSPENPMQTQIVELHGKLTKEFTYPGFKLTHGDDASTAFTLMNSQGLDLPGFAGVGTISAACFSVNLQWACFNPGVLEAHSTLYRYLRITEVEISAASLGEATAYLVPIDAQFSLLIVTGGEDIETCEPGDRLGEVLRRLANGEDSFGQTTNEVWLPAFESHKTVETLADVNGLGLAEGRTVAHAGETIAMRLHVPMHKTGNVVLKPSGNAAVITDSFLVGKLYAAVLSTKLDEIVSVPYLAHRVTVQDFKKHEG